MYKYRHELKYVINSNQAIILKQRLALYMSLDNYQYYKDGSYYIKSLYFDDIDNSSYYEKIDGMLYRTKYRIRTYNNSLKKIYLERKMKHNNLTSKDKELISKDIYSKIISGNIDNIDSENNSLLNKFLLDMHLKNLKPSVIVGYKRTAYIYPISNVRITFDENIVSQGFNYDLFIKNATNINVLDKNEVVLEVKYDDILPK
ncbi:MAG TPA: polyphosphate polymerase domain-containing protein, partial [Bacilli bacterium]|nr:polyphosphate polymerase domain-containing protein [Bacilli bacterium]